MTHNTRTPMSAVMVAPLISHLGHLTARCAPKP